MNKSSKLIIVGDHAFAEVAFEYFTHDSSYEVVAFSVEAAYLKRNFLFNLPVVPFETLDQSFGPDDHSLFVAIPYTQLNRLRTRLAEAGKQKHYQLASYISSKACVWPNVKVGEHCFIFEQNVVQPFAEIGNNVVLWSGNHIGHHSVVRENCFLSSHVVISGFAEVGANCFLGVNCCLGDRIKVARDCVIGAGAVVLRDTEANKVYRGNPASAAAVSSLRMFGVREP